MNTIQKNKSSYYHVFLYLLTVSMIGSLIFFGGTIIANFDDYTKKSAITVESEHQQATVFINDEQVGITPFESTNIKPGDNKIAIKTDNQIYETTINFLPQDNNGIYNILIKKDLGVSNIFSSGQEFWYEKNSSLLLKINSDPKEADVYIDDTKVGVTPFYSENITKGEYKIKLHINGYESQEFRVIIDDSYTVNVNAKLFPMPIPLNISKFEDSNSLYKVYSKSDQVLSNTQMWVNSIIYYNKTRGINIDNLGNNKELVFDYFIDYKGNIFDSLGNLTSKDKINKVKRGAYLGNTNQGDGLSLEARNSYLSLTNKIDTNKVAKVLSTGTGWLRVRSGPSVSSTEIQKVNEGQSYNVLDEQNNWVKLQINQDISGWVLSEYVLIQEVDETT